jgi:ubiquinone/menaquinone biosynthesis C-methylase UbiE
VAGSFKVSVDLSLKPKQAFDAFVDELSSALEARGLKVSGLSRGGKILQGDFEVGVFDKWHQGKIISIRWHPKNWEAEATNNITIDFAVMSGGTRITLESRNWGDVLGDNALELLGWFSGEVVAPVLSASAPARLGDWITDRRARRPSGKNSRRVYGNPVYHWPNFLAILDALQLVPGDNLVEVGCGGGAFLHEALKSGCRASAIDHSADMVKLATEANSRSVATGRLKVTIGDADELPYPAGTFTCAVMTGVLPFLPDPGKAFKEVYRVLRKGGRFLVFTSSKEMRGTPAAPEPVASRISFYDDGELERLAHVAGFGQARVEHPELFEYAKKAGVPKSDLGMFRGRGGSQLLMCHKS